MRHLLASALVGASLLVPAAVVAAPPASAAPVCSFSQSADGHTLYALCTSGGGNQYKVTATFCNQGSCVRQGSNWAYYGNQTHITSGGYFSGGSWTVSTRTVA